MMEAERFKCQACGKEFRKDEIFTENNFLHGDIYFKFTCSTCNTTGSGPLIVREPITWPIIIHLVLYHLIQTNPNRKFFKMKEDICATIIKHWNDIIPHKVRSSTWENTLSSALSTHPDSFVSGQDEMKQLGWWTLRQIEPPPYFIVPGSSRRPRIPIPKVLPALSKGGEAAKLSEKQSSLGAINKLTPAQLEAVVTKLTKKRQQSVQLDKDEQWTNCQELHSLIRHQKNNIPIIKRLFRKLYLRHLRQQFNLKQFDLDQCLLDYIKSKPDASPYQIPSIYRMKISELPFVSNPALSYLGKYWKEFPNETSVESNVDYIRRDWDNCPAKLGVLRFFSSELHPIDFVHLTPHLLAPVNRLLCQFFWPSIDVSEFLSISQYSIVATYKKLVVGCAFMTVNPCYIPYLLVHPDWECAGIGSFMLYYLIGLSHGKDITLHASASNNALMLYQKFGFKPEEFIVNFYDKYFHPSNTASKNAFFLRLKR